MLNMTLLLHVAGVPDLLAVIGEDQLGLVHLLVGGLDHPLLPQELLPAVQASPVLVYLVTPLLLSEEWYTGLEPDCCPLASRHVAMEQSCW